MVTDVSSEHPDGSATSGASAPTWAEELLDVLAARRRLLVASAGGLSLLGILAAIVLPGFVPPRPVVGAAVGVAVVLLSIAIAVAADSADLTLRGARHVRAAGGRVAATLPMGARFDEADALAASIDARAEVGGRHWVALAPASRDLRGISDWADALGVCLSRRNRRVVVIDLYSGSTPGRAGVLEVVHDEVRLARAVDFDRELMLARLGAGQDALAALEALPGLVPRLPRDIEILVVALPPLGQPGALSVAGTLDRVLVFAETDTTSRVDLIASLDALDATETASEVVLLERARRARPAAASTGTTEVVDPAREPEVAEDAGPVAEAPAVSVEADPSGPVPTGSAPLGSPPPVPTPDTAEVAAEPASDDHRRDDVPPVRDMAADEALASDTPTSGRPAGRGHDDDVLRDADPRPQPTPTPDLPGLQEHTDAAAEPDDGTDGDLAAAAALYRVASRHEAEGQPPVDPVPASPFARPADPHPAGEAHAATEEILPVTDAVPAVDPEDAVAGGSPAPAAPAHEDRSGDEDGLVGRPASEQTPTFDLDRGDHVSQPGRWATPNGHEILTGASLGRPRHDDEDPLRVAAALQTLAAEVWSRDDERD